MPSFGKESSQLLKTCHTDLQDLFKAVVKLVDCKVISGYRTTEEQQELYAQGRTKPGAIVTKTDGVTRRSKHQGLLEEPGVSLAVDIIPYPVDWLDKERFYFFAGFTYAMAVHMGIKVRWGGDWDGDLDLRDQSFYDLAHWEVVS